MTFISSIECNNYETYATPILSFDIDWAHDEVIADVLNLISNYTVDSTWMVTHQTDLIQEISSNSSCELGIHPNFNFLLSGDFRNGKSAQEIVERMMVLLPNAKVVRSHSVCQSSRLSHIFASAGIEYESNDYIPGGQVSPIHPWKLENSLTKVPYFFSDELACLGAVPSIADLVSYEGLKVFDFHPIHVFLNTESLDRYEKTRSVHHNPSELIKHRYTGYGTRSRLIDLLDTCFKS